VVINSNLKCKNINNLQFQNPTVLKSLKKCWEMFRGEYIPQYNLEVGVTFCLLKNPFNLNFCYVTGNDRPKFLVRTPRNSEKSDEINA
jgi:hypothetical protein